MKRSANLWLLLIVAVCGLSFWFGRGLKAGAPGHELPAAVATTESPETGVAEEPVHVVVLNGTGQAGLARDVGLLLGRSGYVVEKVGNAPGGPYELSFLVNRRLPAARARTLAAGWGGLPVLREFDARTAADVVLVLGQDGDRLRARLSGAGATP